MWDVNGLLLLTIFLTSVHDDFLYMGSKVTLWILNTIRQQPSLLLSRRRSPAWCMMRYQLLCTHQMEFTIENRLLRRGCSSAVLINLITNPNFLMWKAIGLLKATRFLLYFFLFQDCHILHLSFYFLLSYFFITIFCFYFLLKFFVVTFCRSFVTIVFLLGIVAIIFS